MSLEVSSQRSESAPPGAPDVQPAATVALRALVLNGRHDAGAALGALLVPFGWSVELNTRADAALLLLERFRPHALVIELELVGRNGFALIEHVRQFDPEIPIVIVTRRGGPETAGRAMRAGAQHFVALPSDAGAVPQIVRDVTEFSRRAAVSRPSPSEPAPAPSGEVRWIVGASEPMRELERAVTLVARTRTTVLLTGETGTGKERVAESIHARSPRAAAPFVALHCAALSETLLESELFGHEKGAFTGANARREGRFKQADGGTILLDEVGEISPAVQVKLLRVLQERKFERVGSNETLTVDVRIIAATNRDLGAMVDAGTFRADLYYRFNVMALEVPPLRARLCDIPLLVTEILSRLAREAREPPGLLTPGAMAALAQHCWPGNVRELENVLERALVLAAGAEIDESHLGRQVHRPAPEGRLTVPGATFAEIERNAILTTYEACGRSVPRTAEMLGLSPRTIHYRLREYSGGLGRRRRPPVVDLPELPAAEPAPPRAVRA